MFRTQSTHILGLDQCFWRRCKGSNGRLLLVGGCLVAFQQSCFSFENDPFWRQAKNLMFWESHFPREERSKIQSSLKVCVGRIHFAGQILATKLPVGYPKWWWKARDFFPFISGNIPKKVIIPSQYYSWFLFLTYAYVPGLTTYL